MEIALNLRAIYPLVAVLIAIVIDTGLGVFRAISLGEFDLKKMPQFLQTKVLPVFGSLMLMAVFMNIKIEGVEWLGWLEIVYHASWATALASYGGEILKKVNDLIGTVEVPGK